VTSEQLSGPRLSSLYYSCNAIKRGLVIPGYEGGREGGRGGGIFEPVLGNMSHII